MYDDTLVLFKYWNGSSWTTITEGALGFTFNFAKYRSAWNIAQPDVLHIMLGTNDFATSSETGMEADWPAWKTRMDTFYASVRADSPNCKFIVAIPNSSGKQGKDGVMYYERRKRAYWYHANEIIKAYASREGEKIYVLDYHSTVDREFGFDNADEKPFEEYTGTLTDQYKADPVHLGANGFAQMGNVYMGIIQSFR
jgi:hypothetical protein